MFEVRFLPSGKTIRAASGTTVLHAARAAGVMIESPCGGAGTCGKCKVRLDAGSLAHVKQWHARKLTAEDQAQGYVLACAAEIAGDITVEILGQPENRTLKILSQGKSFDVALDAHITKAFDPGAGTTTVFAGGKEIGTEAGDTAGQTFGVVVDIGTTTLVASLIDLMTGAELQSTSALNPQAVYAQDVLSRISYAAEEAGLRTLYTEIVREINSMIGIITAAAGVSSENIYEVIFSGNTCMLHLAANVSPYSLGRFPYTPALNGGQYLEAAGLGLAVSTFGLVYLPPIISAYVGADITSGILATQMVGRKDTALLIDIGTNGEIVIGAGGRLSAASTAAGPAFEGMNITFGMRASAGAIEFFAIEDGGEIAIRTIEDAAPVGICGSGLLDIVGELVAHGLINKNGRFVSPDSEGLAPSLRERLVKIDGKTVFLVTDGIYLTQKDVRQVQLAKGAVRTGIEFLLKNKGLNAQDVDKVLIAGSFGFHLRAKSLVNIGLLPGEFEGKIDFIGNTSKSGGIAFLLNRSYRDSMKKLVSQVEVVELSGYADFDRMFVKQLEF